MPDSTHPTALSLPTQENPATVYSATVCPQCNATYRSMEREDVPFQVINAQEDQEAGDLIKAMGYQRAPVVVLPDGTHWGGFRPDMIKDLGQAIKAAALETAQAA